MVLSALADASVRPSGLNATPKTVLACPVSAPSGLRLRTSHSLIVSSLPPDASVRPSGLNATLQTELA
jgi:hypothetical protein